MSDSLRPDASGDIARRTITGLRWVMALNVATIPLSFLTNVLLGRVSAEALGYYGAIQLFATSFMTFVFLGGPAVFARFVPRIDGRKRLDFLLSYTGLVMAVFAVGVLAGWAIAPRSLSALLQRYGRPAPAIAVFFSVAVLLAFATNSYLWGALEGKAAAIQSRLPVAGFFVAALAAAGPFRSRLGETPDRFLWISALAVYALSGAYGCVAVARSRSRVSGRPRWYLPAGFWSVTFYGYLETLVVFAYNGAVQAMVLLWLDVRALGYLHPAIRFVTMLESLVGMLAQTVAPALARLDSAGRREDALRQARTAMNGTAVPLVAAVLALVFFAPDAMGMFGTDFRAGADLLRLAALSALAAPVVQYGGAMMVAFGALRSYLSASLVYVAVALAMTAASVPLFGLRGAAAVTTLGAFARHVTLTIALRRSLGYRAGSRVQVAWACGAAAVWVAWEVEPGRAMAVLLWAVFFAAFCVAGRVRWPEVVSSVRRLVGGA